MNTINTINNHPVMIRVLKDSYGGVMYNVANRNKYEAAELLAIWDGLDASEQEIADGLVWGAINFLKS